MHSDMPRSWHPLVAHSNLHWTCPLYELFISKSSPLCRAALNIKCAELRLCTEERFSVSFSGSVNNSSRSIKFNGMINSLMNV